MQLNLRNGRVVQIGTDDHGRSAVFSRPSKLGRPRDEGPHAADRDFGHDAIRYIPQLKPGGAVLVEFCLGPEHPFVDDGARCDVLCNIVPVIDNSPDGHRFIISPQHAFHIPAFRSY